MPPSAPDAIDHIARWQRIVVARREQHDAVCDAQGRTTGDYWARRAKGFRKFAQDSAAAGDPLIECLSRHIQPEDTVLDVGAGTGRHTIPLARSAKHVTALDPSQSMLGFLREDIASQGLTNIDVVEGGWPDAAAQAPQADIVLSAHVLYPIEDVVSFLRALDGRSRRLCFLHLMVWQPWFDQLGLWKTVHREERRPQPTYIEVVNVLHQLGCFANVEVAWSETPRSFDTLDDAVERFAESVAVGDDEQRARLRDALAAQLEQLEGGGFAFPHLHHPVATVWWEAGALA